MIANLKGIADFPIEQLERCVSAEWVLSATPRKVFAVFKQPDQLAQVAETRTVAKFNILTVSVIYLVTQPKR